MKKDSLWGESFFLFLFELLDVVREGCEVWRCVFVVRVSYYFLPLSEFFRVSNVGFGVGAGLAEDFAIAEL